ncbi:MAG TPA: sigma-70 family RNA polymerase sigma factor [Xanthobacteraceae bacterium]|nr:sigma-70 family RNA polymerase sigma factor [Xanthobacteraceae bacterium]
MEARAAFDRLLGDLRSKLHRYCARMTGSVIDGEDVVQEALIKAIEALPDMGSIAHPEGWLFRIAHNAAVDFPRRRARQDAARSEEDPDMLVDPASTADDRQVATTASLYSFMRLPATQRSCVILMDVLGYSLREIGEVIDSSIPSVKAALHRGRVRLRELAQKHDDRPLPILTEPQRSLLAAYVDRFNARDFEAIRNMLADEVRLELVNKTRMNGKGEVGKYFGNYSLARDWQLVPGFVDRRPAILVRDPGDASGAPTYFVLLDWAGDRLIGIRDFRHARYATDGAELLVLG